MTRFIEKTFKFLKNFIHKSKKFVGDTISELKKSSWPAKNELMENTLLVIVAVVVLGGFVASVDWLIMHTLLLVTK